MKGAASDEWVNATDLPSATLFSIADGVVITAALIAGDGVDLVVTPRGGRHRTVQLTCSDARELATALNSAADQSEKLL